MPVWGVWAEDALWFSSAKDSRKTHNLEREPRAVMTTEDPKNPVVVEGTVELAPEMERIAEFAARVDAKYGTNYGVEFFASGSNGCYRLTPQVAFGIAEGDFTGSPTRWRWPA